jgi:ligand-binding sensor domain-containing protein
MKNRNSLRRFLAALICFAFLHEDGYAQSPPPLHFEHYTSENGLSHNSTNAMMIDSKGFVWIGAFDGLNRFDGYDFRFYGNNPFDTTTISRAWPWAMAEGSNGIIWISTTIPQGLNRYDPVTGKFFRLHSLMKLMLTQKEIFGCPRMERDLSNSIR